MNASLQTWLTVSVNSAAAVAFLYIGKRLGRWDLGGVGVAFVIAAILVGGEPLHLSPAAVACGNALGFVASVLGLLGLLKAYAERRHENGKS